MLEEGAHHVDDVDSLLGTLGREFRARLTRFHAVQYVRREDLRHAETEPLFTLSRQREARLENCVCERVREREKEVGECVCVCVILNSG